MIYFIQDGNLGPVKIGTTVRLGDRLAQLKASLGSAFVQVREGVNVGSEGWVQRELLAPMPAH